MSLDTVSVAQAEARSRDQRPILVVLLRDWRAMAGAVLVLAVAALALLGPLWVTGDPDAFSGAVYAAPSADHPLGSDVLGRDVMTRLLLGGQVFLTQGVIAAIAGVGAGVLLGLLISVLRGAASRVVLFFSDSVMVIPQILLVLVILAAFGATTVTLIVSVALAQVAYTARVVEAAARRVVAQDYYRAARAIGRGRLALMVTEVLPNILGVVLVEFGVRLAVAFVALASLSYLGFAGDAISWGKMIHENQGGISVQPWAVFAPVLAIALFLVGMNLVRDGVARAVTERSAR